MEPKSPTYEKLVNDKPPLSPVLRPFRLKFRKMLSSGSLKIRSTPASPCCDKEEFSFQSNSAESLVGTGSSSGFSSRPSSMSSLERSPLAKEAFDGKSRVYIQMYRRTSISEERYCSCPCDSLARTSHR
ncbi:hypothetical protein BDFB_011165 [Asbolus verrucosus]|uniref:Uncharacterized protein n=1 Tax=Asbolus verrucosus TaxID=1661398 RepID=A0A482VFV3_ASBVE|nr:hypothetical protein BDFB_011165 [Asbolus verrucosus]